MPKPKLLHYGFPPSACCEPSQLAKIYIPFGIFNVHPFFAILVATDSHCTASNFLPYERKLLVPFMFVSPEGPEIRLKKLYEAEYFLNLLVGADP
mmetsp:Transcript_1167/g.4566  ORF Transcript_1167/g.4566 Transcript_1167/m.4566 type:complete len:95 (+) Transcript_1167:2439-2723(+)